MRLLVEDVTIHAYTHHVQGELSRDKLLALAQRRYSSVQEHLRNRRTRLQEYGDYRFLQTWLLAVRGVQLKEPLKLAVPPLVGDRTDSWTNNITLTVIYCSTTCNVVVLYSASKIMPFSRWNQVLATSFANDDLLYPKLCIVMSPRQHTVVLPR